MLDGHQQPRQIHGCKPILSSTRPQQSLTLAWLSTANENDISDSSFLHFESDEVIVTDQDRIHVESFRPNWTQKAIGIS
ncbi:hypothetical protein BO71DRAFT_395558 [Aspergillus ellipticus CBS 707.79]|uniref:Uncharacterized protein n=1 Tax=Aspergillus ellipticus CBS 707.79 TaxID=1448320 RepID=A0A319DKJ9_9EURO|nr:hypothetical protein BO71DRAFT_395558 [Aspergillus ellipticus CBS 707.79]